MKSSFEEAVAEIAINWEQLGSKWKWVTANPESGATQWCLIKHTEKPVQGETNWVDPEGGKSQGLSNDEFNQFPEDFREHLDENGNWKQYLFERPQEIKGREIPDEEYDQELKSPMEDLLSRLMGGSAEKGIPSFADFLKSKLAAKSGGSDPKTCSGKLTIHWKNIPKKYEFVTASGKKSPRGVFLEMWTKAPIKGDGYWDLDPEAEGAEVSKIVFEGYDNMHTIHKDDICTHWEEYFFRRADADANGDSVSDRVVCTDCSWSASSSKPESKKVDSEPKPMKIKSSGSSFRDRVDGYAKSLLKGMVEEACVADISDKDLKTIAKLSVKMAKAVDKACDE